MKGKSTPRPAAGRRSPWRWLSTVLIVAGGLLLAISGVLATHDASALLPPKMLASLDGNPLLVGTAAATPAPRVVRYVTPSATSAVEVTVATPTPTATTTPTSELSAPEPPIRIVAAAINLDAPVVPVGWTQATQDGTAAERVWDVADFAAGWHNTSAVPGQSGNIVISGHHNTRGEVFRDVVNLKPGDSILLFTPQRTYSYTVASRLILRDKGMPEAVRRDNARWIGPFPEQRLTLVTCWPHNSNTHRVIVVAKPAQ